MRFTSQLGLFVLLVLIPVAGMAAMAFLGLSPWIGIMLGIIGILISATLYQIYLNHQRTMTIDYLEKLGSGDVTARLNRKVNKDYQKLAEIVSTNNKNTKGIIGKMLTTSEQLLNLIERIKHSGDEMEDSFALVSRNINEITSAIDNMSKDSLDMQNDAEEMRSGMQQVSNQSSAAEEIAKLMKINLDHNNKNTLELIKRMRYSAEQNMKISDEVLVLREEMRKISEIVNVISGISSQTNLLALNASIEAARAGDAGRGFAVVAEEVRKLAEQSNTSSENISRIISEIVSRTEDITEKIHSEVKSANDNVKFADESNALLTVSFDSVNDTLSIIQEIIALIEHQNNATDDVYKLIRSISEESQEVTANIEETAALTDVQLTSLNNIVSALENLLNISNTLGNVVAEYKKGLRVSREVELKVDSSLKVLKDFAAARAHTGISGITRKHLSDIQNVSKDFELVALLDQNGIAFEFSHDVGISKVDASHRPFFKQSIVGKDYRSEPYISSVSNDYCISVSTPLLKDGQIVGVIMLDLSLS